MATVAESHRFAGTDRLAPAYDMLPMGFAPRPSGAMSDVLPPASLQPGVANAVWARALGLARGYPARLQADGRFSAGFRRCLDGLAAHIDEAGTRVSRLG